MSKPIKSAAGTEAEMSALQVVIDKALGFPRKGTHVGGRGVYVNMPDTWDGTGPTPPGWAASATVPWVATPLDAVLPLPDDIAAELQAVPVQARLSASERLSISSAIASRPAVVLDGRTPKTAAALAEPAIEPHSTTTETGLF